MRYVHQKRVSLGTALEEKVSKKVSIVIPVYNLEKNICFCLQSVCNQTYRNLEIIIVDDGSNDNSSLICEAYLNLDQRISIVKKQNGGVSSARNCGLAFSAGEFIAFVDGDDILASDFIERLVAAYNSRIALSMCKSTRIKSYQTFEGIKVTAEPSMISSSDAIKKLLTGSINPSVCCALFRKEFVVNLCFNTGIKNNEDKLFLYEYLAKVKQYYISICDDQLYGYYVREGSASNSSFKANNFSTIIVSDLILQSIRNDYSDLVCFAQNDAVSSRIDYLKGFILSKYDDAELYNSIKNEVLSMKINAYAGKRLRVSYSSLRVGDWCFALLVKIYYRVYSERMRFRVNEKSTSK